MSASLAGMRIVAGSARGRRLVVPSGDRTRPTTDRVREAVFNALFSLDAIENATFCDLFAGSGALGLEALSRGATHCTFVERDRDALAAIEDNISALGFGDETRIAVGDAMGVAVTGGPFDVVLADPPYGFDQWPALLDVLADRGTGLVVAEAGEPIDPHPRWTTIRDKAYGSTVVTILAPAGAADSEESM